MERICEYCKNSFIPKRTDALYCSHSCRQLAYVLRKVSTQNPMGNLNKVVYNPEASILQQKKQEPSISQGLIKNYPLAENKNVELSVNKLTDKAQEPSINQGLINDYPSTAEDLSVKKESALSVNPDKKEVLPDVKAVNAIIKSKEEQENYIEYGSPLVDEIAQLTEERNNLGILYSFLHNRTESSAYWVSLRYRCLVECLLTFSEMQSIELDDLKEMCNAFTSVIQSKSFGYLIAEYPYTKEIVWLRDTIKNICLNADEDEPMELRFKKETKLKLIAARWELANYIPKTSFNILNFTE